MTGMTEEAGRTALLTPYTGALAGSLARGDRRLDA
jgi:hypothetical protein